MRQLWQKFNKRKCRKKSGEMIAVEAVFCTMILLMAFTAMSDLITLSNRRAILTSTAEELARTLSVQGGALDAAPQGYASRTYYTNDELGRLVQKNMNRAGFKDGEWKVTLEYTRTYDDSTNSTTICDPPQSQDFLGFDSSGTFYANRTAKIDYLSNFNVIVTGTYKYRYLSLFIGKKCATLGSLQVGLSEWRYNFDYWPGELEVSGGE